MILSQQGAELIPSFEHIKPGSNQVNVGIYNSTHEKVVLQKGMVVRQVKAANIMPPLLAPKDECTYYDVHEYKSEYKTKCDLLQYILKQSQVGHDPPQPSQERLDKLFSKLNLSGIEDWDKFDQLRIGELIRKYHHIFALEDIELGCTDIIEHYIKLSDPKSFKDRYHRISPTQYEEV